MRIARSILAIFASGLTLGCGDLKDLVALSANINNAYHVTANVNLSNGSHLRITFQNAPASVSKSGPARERFARDVATFAKNHYLKAAALDDITIVFAQVTSAGALTMTTTDGQFSYRPQDLPDSSHVAPPN